MYICRIFSSRFLYIYPYTYLRLRFPPVSRLIFFSFSLSGDIAHRGVARERRSDANGPIDTTANIRETL